MFGAVEQPGRWARHMVRTRDLQRETGGFTEFVPLPFVHMATPIYLQRRARRGPTFRETLLMHAVGRIAYRGAIDNIQVSWVKMGAAGARQAARGPGSTTSAGTLMDENISRAAGASHGQRMGVEELPTLVEPLGRPLEQRTTLYGRVAPRPTAAVRARRAARRRHRGTGPGAPTVLPGGRAARPADRRSSRLRRPGRRPAAVRAPGATCTAPCWRTVWDLAAEGTDAGDLKIADAALAEMAEAFRVFRPYR